MLLKKVQACRELPTSFDLHQVVPTELFHIVIRAEHTQQWLQHRTERIEMNLFLAALVVLVVLVH